MSRKKIQLKRYGIIIITIAHLIGGIDRLLRIKLDGKYPSEIVSTVLRMLES